MPRLSPARSVGTLLAAASTATLVVSLLALPAVTAAPAPTPDPAAPPGGCAVTQDVTQTRSQTAEVSVRRTRATRLDLRTRRTEDGRWSARLRVASSWKGRASVTSTGVYASADCDVAERQVSATRTRAAGVRVTQSVRRTATNRKAAIREARAAVTKRSRREARVLLVTRANDAAFLAARQSFLRTLPNRDVAQDSMERQMPSARQACPTRLASGSRAEQQRALERGETVPQFADAAQVWVCRYSHVDGKVESRRKVSAAQRTRLVAGLRSLTTLDPRIAVACTADIGPTYLVVHVARDGVRTGAVLHDSGCRHVGLTRDAGRELAGGRTSPGVPAGEYLPTARWVDVVRAAS